MPEPTNNEVQDALERLVTLADTYDPGPNQYVRDALDYARTVLAKAHAKAAAQAGKK